MIEIISTCQGDPNIMQNNSLGAPSGGFILRLPDVSLLFSHPPPSTEFI